MIKYVHEIRDPIHVFVRMDNDERKVLDSKPFQRLRNIHQLATTFLVYPGATHKRFEHSIGTMEIATRIFDVITQQNNIASEIRDVIGGIWNNRQELGYWKRVLRIAALCHDIGHLPFSHAAEKELLPEGWDHERLTREAILSKEMKRIWCSMSPPVRAEDVAKLAIGRKISKYSSYILSDWESIRSEIIKGDCFGADRID